MPVLWAESPKSHVLWVSGSVRHVSLAVTLICWSPLQLRVILQRTRCLCISLGQWNINQRTVTSGLHDSVNRVSVMPVHVWHVINTKCSSIEPFPRFRYNTMYFMKRLLVYNSIYICLLVMQRNVHPEILVSALAQSFQCSASQFCYYFLYNNSQL